MSEEKKLTGYPSIDKPWRKYYSEEAINAPLPECTMYEYIKTKNSDNMNAVALEYYGKKITYEEFFKKIEIAAGALEEYGVTQGDIVTVAMINSPETVVLLFALNKIGAVANMIYGVGEEDELAAHINNADSRLVFTLDIFQEKFFNLLKKTKVETVVVSSLSDSMGFITRIGARYLKGMKPVALHANKKFISWNDFMNYCKGKSSTATDSKQTAVITYTGGTTGGSKGVMLSNQAVLAVAQQFIDLGVDLRRTSSWAEVLPLFIAYGVTCSLMVPLIVGMKVILRIPMSESLGKLLKKYKPNHIMYGPAYWEGLANDAKIMDLSYLIEPITGGDTLTRAAEEKINKYLEQSGSKYPLMNGYGMTEVGAGVAVNLLNAHKPETVGIPWTKCTISAFDTETGNELKYGEKGELCIQAPSIMSGYLKNEEETKNIIKVHTDGLNWVHSGDLGYIDEDGFVHICGRLKRYFLYFNNNVQKKVFSLDVESVILENSSVAKCAVVPIDDETHNQVPVAFIIPTNKDCDRCTLLDEIKVYCEKKLKDGYLPKEIYCVDMFPLTKVGKVDYRALEEEAARLQ